MHTGTVSSETTSTGTASTGTASTGVHPADPAPAGPVPAEPEAGPPPRSVPVHLSPSSAATFAQCPRRWRFRYVERLPDPPGAPALVGTLVHRVLERLLGDPPEARTVERARALAAEEWPLHQALPDVVALGLDADGVRRYKWQVWEAVAGLWKLEDPAAVDVLATECRLDVQLGSVPFLGVLDRVDATAEGVVVTDYKSGRPPSPAYAGDKLDQVLLYAAAWRATSGDSTRRARLHYLGARSIEVDTTDEAIDGALGRLHERWDTLHRCLDTDTFAARTGPLCAWCPYTGHCPEGAGEVRRRVEAGLVPLDAPAVRTVA
jgi:putative RecB family exonuclease